MERMLIEKEHSGVMVALYLPPDIAKFLAIEGKEPEEKLHVTLAYIKGIGGNEQAFTSICEAVADVAEDFGPVHGWIGGSGRFNGSETSDFQDVYYASFNSPALLELVNELLDSIEEAGFDPSRVHGFTPHITLAYIGQDEGNPIRKPSSNPFDVPCLSVRSKSFSADIPLTGEYVLKAQPSSNSVHVPSTGDEEETLVAPPVVQDGGWEEPPENNETVGYRDAYKERKRPKSAAVSKSDGKEIPIIKRYGRKQVVYGVILSPDEVDLQGDIMSAEEIEKTAHNYMEEARKIKRRHKDGIDALPVESYIAPMDLHFNDGPYGPSIVKKGAWVMGVKVYDPREWEKVESGEYMAFSVGGMGVRDPA